MEPFETYEVGGMTVELHYDPDPWSPAEWDQMAEMVAGPRLARHYTLTKLTTDGTEDEAIERGGARLLTRYLRLVEGAEVVPFRFDDYGANGARLYTLDDDDHPSGFFRVTREKLIEEYGDDSEESRAKARRVIESEAKSWDSYLQGEVYAFVVKNQDGEHVESLWGIYDDTPGLEYLRSEATSAAEWEDRDRLINQEPTDIAEVLYAMKEGSL